MKVDKQRLEENQAKNNQAEKELDDEYNEALDGTEDEVIDQEKKEVEQDQIPNENQDDDHEDDDLDETPEGKEDDEEPDEEKEEKPKVPEEKKETPKEDDKKPKETERPTKFIPLEKYIPEKKGWQEKLTKANEKIAELESLNSEDKTVGERKEAIEKMAEKWDTKPEFVEDLLSIVEKGNKIDPEKVVEKENEEAEETPAEKLITTEEQIVEKFSNEFEEFTPEIKKLYPKATDGQIQEAKKLMDEYAHSERYKRYFLEDILRIKIDDFKDILSETPDKAGVEGSKDGSGRFKDVTANSFKKDADGDYNFNSVHSMPEGPKKEEIINGMNPEVWDKYVTDLEARQDLEVTKDDGRIVKLN